MIQNETPTLDLATIFTYTTRQQYQIYVRFLREFVILLGLRTRQFLASQFCYLFQHLFVNFIDSFLRKVGNNRNYKRWEFLNPQQKYLQRLTEPNRNTKHCFKAWTPLRCKRRFNSRMVGSGPGTQDAGEKSTWKFQPLR